MSNAWHVLGAYELPHLVDTAGAGDWCTAGLVYDLFTQQVGSRGSWDAKSVMRALAFGQALSTLNCLTEGARGLLDAWTPSKIVRSGRVLTAMRVRAFAERRTQTSSSVRDPKLEKLVKDGGLLNNRPRLKAHNFSCCLAS